MLNANASQVADLQIAELASLELALVGGGSGELVLI